MIETTPAQTVVGVWYNDRWQRWPGRNKLRTCWADFVLYSLFVVIVTIPLRVISGS